MPPDGFSQGAQGGDGWAPGLPHPVRASTVSPLCFGLSSFLTHPGTCLWWQSHSLYVLHYWHVKFWKLLQPFVPLFFSCLCCTARFCWPGDICVAPNQVVPSQRTVGRVAFCFRTSSLHCFSQLFSLRFSHVVGVFYCKKEGWRQCHALQRNELCAKFSSPLAIATRTLRFSSIKNAEYETDSKSLAMGTFQFGFFLS